MVNVNRNTKEKNNMLKYFIEIFLFIFISWGIWNKETLIDFEDTIKFILITFTKEDYKSYINFIFQNEHGSFFSRLKNSYRSLEWYAKQKK